MNQVIQPPNENVWWFDSNSLQRRHVQQNKNGKLMHTVLHLSLLIYNFVGHPIFQVVGSMIVTRIILKPPEV